MKDNKKQCSGNQSDTMKNKEEYNNLDLKFIEAVDEVIAINKELGIKPYNDSSVAKMIYPSNRGIISSVRSRSKHIPHLALMNFAKEFNVDMNYFYKSETKLQYQPPIIKNIVLKGNSVETKGDSNVTIHAGNEGKIQGINTAESGSKNTLVEVVEVNTMINNFISKINDDYVDQFFRIVGQIQGEAKATRTRLEKLLQDKSEELTNLRESYRGDLRNSRSQLSKTQAKLEESQMRENELLRKYISKIE